MKYSLIVLPLICLFSSSCKKEPKYYTITDQRLRDGVNFKVGSYFIYRDSVTNELDSVSVTSSNHFDQYNAVSDKTFETAYFYDNSMLGGCVAGGGNLDMIWTNYNFPGLGHAIIHLVQLPFPERQIVTDGKNSYQYLKYYDVYVLNGVSYKEVYEVQTDRGNDYIHSFYSLQSGLIKYIIKTNSYYYVRSLEKSFIIR